MDDRMQSAVNLLRLVRSETDAIGVAMSFGKDSLMTLDLCCRIFSRVEGYYLFRVRDLSIVQEWEADVHRRYGMRIMMLPHFDLSRCYRHAVLQPHYDGLQTVPRLLLPDIESYFRRKVKVNWIAYGWRRNDSFSRALIMRRTGGYDPDAHRVFPLRSFRRQDVYAYLQSRGIAHPKTLGRKDQGGLDFHPGALAELRDHYPEDYARWLRDFPFSGVQFIDSPVSGSPKLRKNSISPSSAVDGSDEHP